SVRCARQARRSPDSERLGASPWGRLDVGAAREPPLPRSRSRPFKRMDHSAPNPPTHRRSIRLRGHDYASAGTYYVTICTQARRCLFGHIENGSMTRNTCGDAVAEGWQWLATRFEGIALDEWIVMPNHLHGIVVRQDASIGVARFVPSR